MLRFNFDAQAGETPASIAQKRALVAQIMGTARAPTTFGEGLSALGDGIVANVLGGRAAEAEKSGQASADDTFSQLVASITGQGASTPSYGPATASDATAAMAGGDFLSGLVNSESGGNWDALNNEGYGGRLQFGDDRLTDAAAAGLVPPGTTGAMFSEMSPEQQQAVEAWHFGDIDRQAAGMGLDQYFGQTVGGVPINAESVRAMAHLGGIDGARRFIESGGSYNPADSNGTRLSDYGMRFGGGSGAPAQVAQGPGLAALMEAASNPWLSDSQKAIINSMLQQEMQAMDPMRQLQMQAAQQGLEKGAIELDALRNPTVEPQPLINTGDGRIFDPNKGEWIVAPTGGAEAPDLVELFDPETGLPYKAQWNPATGEFDRVGGIKAPSGTQLSVDPATGAVTFQQGVGLKPLTEAQSKDAVYSTRAAGALPLIDQYGSALTDPVQHALGIDPTGVVRGNQSPDFQRAHQAGQEFLQAILRKDTGAAITAQETDQYGKVYLPQPGDSPEVLEQKRVSRQRALAAIEAGMPPQAILQQEQALAASSPDSATTPGGIPTDVPPELWEVMTEEERALWQ